MEQFERYAWAAPFFVLAAGVLFLDLAPARVWPAVALVLIGALIAFVPRQAWLGLLERIESASVGPISIALQQEAGKAAADSRERDTTEGSKRDDPGAVKDVFDLRQRLEWKLTYVAKHLLGSGPDKVTFITIGSLRYDGYLTETDARTAIGILNIRQEELEALPKSAQERFLSEAGEFVESVRARIFWGQVKRRLEGRDGGAEAFAGFAPSRGRRDDLLADSPAGIVRVAPAFALDEGSKILKGAIERVRREKQTASVKRQIVVVPDGSDAEAPAGRPEVVQLAGLMAALGHA